MLNWAITFFLLTIVASVFGFGGGDGAFATGAKFVAILSVILCVAALVLANVKKSPPKR